MHTQHVCAYHSSKKQSGKVQCGLPNCQAASGQLWNQVERITHYTDATYLIQSRDAQKTGL